MQMALSGHPAGQFVKKKNRRGYAPEEAELAESSRKKGIR